MGAKQERRPSRKAKIVATVGPATQDATRLKSVIEAGVDAFRLNFSHGLHETFRKVYQRIRAASRRLDKPVAVVADLQGPKVRMGPLAGNLEVSPADTIIVTGSKRTARATGSLWVNRRGAIARLRRGDRLMVDDVEALIGAAVSRLKKDFRLKKGERIVMIMGVPSGIPKGTNQLRVVEIEAAGQR